MRGYQDIGVFNFALTGVIASGAILGQFNYQEYYFYKNAIILSMDLSLIFYETTGGKLHRDNGANITVEYLQQNRPYLVEGTGAGLKDDFTIHIDTTAFVKKDVFLYASASEPFRFGGDLFETATVGKELTAFCYISVFYSIT